MTDPYATLPGLFLTDRTLHLFFDVSDAPVVHYQGVDFLPEKTAFIYMSNGHGRVQVTSRRVKKNGDPGAREEDLYFVVRRDTDGQLVVPEAPAWLEINVRDNAPEWFAPRPADQ
jgi:hypothetical protein